MEKKTNIGMQVIVKHNLDDVMLISNQHWKVSRNVHCTVAISTRFVS